MNFYEKLRKKTTLTPYEVVDEMKEIAPIENKNLSVDKYLECEKGLRKMEGVKLDSFLNAINQAKRKKAGTKLKRAEMVVWFNDLIENLHDKMKEFNVKSQVELSQKTGVAQSTISTILSKRTNPSYTTMQRFYNFFGDSMNIEVKPESKFDEAGQKNKGIYDELKELIRTKRFTQAILAKEIGINSSSISKLYNGQMNCFKKDGFIKAKEFLKRLHGETTEEQTKEPASNDFVEELKPVVDLNCEPAEEASAQDEDIVTQLKETIEKQRKLIENYETLISIIKSLQNS